MAIYPYRIINRCLIEHIGDNYFGYSLEPKKEIVEELKREEIAKAGDIVQLYQAEVYNNPYFPFGWAKSYLTEQDSCYMHQLLDEQRQRTDHYHKFTNVNDPDRLKQLLEEYYTSEFLDHRSFVAYGPACTWYYASRNGGNSYWYDESIETFLLVSKYDHNGFMKDIISVPETLFLLQKLMIGDFKSIDFNKYGDSELLYKLLSMFEISSKPVYNFTEDDLVFSFDTESTGVVQKYGHDFNYLDNNIDATEKILGYCKKRRLL